MLKTFSLLIFIFSLFAGSNVFAQKTDSLAAVKNIKKKNTNIFLKGDTAKAYNPRIATYRSAILPGWGQATNKKYWKMPIVYAALGTTAYIFFAT